MASITHIPAEQVRASKQLRPKALVPLCPSFHLLNEALLTIEHGFKIFPIKAGQRCPPLPDFWASDATSRPEQVTEWWTRWPDANIGILTTGLLVVEVDVLVLIDTNGVAIGTIPNDWSGINHFADEICPIVEMPSGGKQYIFRPPEGTLVPTTFSRLGRGVNTAGERGYILAPPSLTEDGQCRWMSGYGPSEVTIPDAPYWVVNFLLGGGRATDLDRKTGKLVQK